MKNTHCRQKNKTKTQHARKRSIIRCAECSLTPYFIGKNCLLLVSVRYESVHRGRRACARALTLVRQPDTNSLPVELIAPEQKSVCIHFVVVEFWNSFCRCAITECGHRSRDDACEEMKTRWKNMAKWQRAVSTRMHWMGEGGEKISWKTEMCVPFLLYLMPMPIAHARVHWHSFDQANKLGWFVEKGAGSARVASRLYFQRGPTMWFLHC